MICCASLYVYFFLFSLFWDDLLVIDESMVITELLAKPEIWLVRLSFPEFWIEVGVVQLGSYVRCWAGTGGCVSVGVRVELNF